MPLTHKYLNSHQPHILIYLLQLRSTTNTSTTFRHVYLHIYKHIFNKFVAPYLAITYTTKTASLLYKIIYSGSEGGYLQTS